MQTVAGMLTVLGGLCLVYGIVDRCLLAIERCSRYKWASKARKEAENPDAGKTAGESG